MIVRHCGLEDQHAAHEWESHRGELFACVGTTPEGEAIARRYRYSLGRVQLAPAPIEWGLTMCRRRRCVEPAACSIDGEPYCLQHADDEIERACVPAELAAMMPELDE